MKILLSLITLFFTQHAFANKVFDMHIELRATYGTAEHNADTLNKGGQLSWARNRFLSQSDVMGGDLMVSFFAGRVPIGVR